MAEPGFYQARATVATAGVWGDCNMYASLPRCELSCYAGPLGGFLISFSAFLQYTANYLAQFAFSLGIAGRLRPRHAYWDWDAEHSREVLPPIQLPGRSIPDSRIGAFLNGNCTKTH